MPKVITLEKAADGSYTVPENPIVEEVKEEIVDDPFLFEKTVVMPETKQCKSNKKVHKFIVENGQNASEFLDGVNKTFKLLMAIKKMTK